MTGQISYITCNCRFHSHVCSLSSLFCYREQHERIREWDIECAYACARSSVWLTSVDVHYMARWHAVLAKYLSMRIGAMQQRAAERER